MRFCSSGSEAVHAAIRIARAATGRWKVARFEGHYHGWLDTIYIGESPDAERPAAPAAPGTRGQPRSALADVIVLPWNDPDALAAAMHIYRGQIAAVILEPILCNTGVIPPRPGFVEAIREWCDRVGAVLIFDEVITGFRVALGGAQSLLGIRPDLTVFGKAVANGFPLSVVGGRRDLMEHIASGAVLHGGTYNGNLPAMAAARATLDALSADGGAVYGGITDTGRSLMDGLRRAGAEAGVPVLVQGVGPVFHMWISNRPSIDEPRTARTEGRSSTRCSPRRCCAAACGRSRADVVPSPPPTPPSTSRGPCAPRGRRSRKCATLCRPSHRVRTGTRRMIQGGTAPPWPSECWGRPFAPNDSGIRPAAPATGATS